ncbi:MAG TPA: histidine phosphatase family protein [Noviherbaspirillum sp.]|uniref:histidine phosphatase family protein n=1 Tax=Noviherbaspirillum sp. TaxID=1926288 RepID=UPI002D4539D4|nr:histidine phosphatase family protein [Noviherbaspirillum sp.]HYD95193.1 histidine phosphatase family protein [Noviherbaspirillum sp.]
MRLYLVRHARPAVADGVCYGSSDLPVPEQEQRQALAQLAAALPKGIPLFSSPLQRCLALAAALAPALRTFAPIVDPRLAEMHFGAWELRAWETVPRAEIDAWAADLVHYRPGGGENVLEVAQRVQAFLDALRRRQEDAAIVVCHAGTIRMLLACLQAASVEQAAQAAAAGAHRIAYGGLTTVDC